MSLVSLVVDFPSKEVAIQFQVFLSNELEGLLQNCNGLKDVDQEVAQETLLMPVSIAKDVSLPVIQTFKWYQVQETEDEYYLITFETPPFSWPKDIFRKFLHDVFTPIFHYFVQNRVLGADQEYCLLLKGLRIDDGVLDESIYYLP